MVGAPFSNLGSIDGSDIAIAVALGLLVLPISLELIWRGPRYISAPEVSLVLLLEAILGPALIWLALGDPPTIQAVLAGVLILGTLATHAVLAQRGIELPPLAEPVQLRRVALRDRLHGRARGGRLEQAASAPA